MITIRFILLLFILSHATALLAPAKEVGKAQALAIASAFSQAQLSRKAPLPEPAYTATGSDALRSAGSRPLFYAYNLEGGGFVIVSAETQAWPVLAYSDEGEFSAEGMPASLSALLKHYEEEIAAAVASNLPPEASLLSEWEAIRAGKARTAAQEARIQTAIWDQNDPYNIMCPKDGRSITQTGCVATAMGIVMKYHRWPVRGQGSIKYSTKTKNISVSATFNVDYQWDSMLATYNRSGGGSWTQQQAEAVATLLFHCGAAVEMDYLVNGSGATEWAVVRAMTENFGYDKSLMLAYRDIYSTAEWDSLMQREINEGRPILYGGITGYSVEEDEGHQFVVDGYSVSAPTLPGEAGKSYYHINWGWNGSSNGHYLLSALNPNSAHKGYNLEQDAVIGLRKDEGGKLSHEMFFVGSDAEVDPASPTGLMADVDSIRQGTPFNLITTYVADYGIRHFEGSWGFFVVSAAGVIKDSLEVVDYDLPAGYGVMLSSDTAYVINSKIEEGDHISLYYRSKGHNWRMVRGLPGSVVRLPLSTGIGSSAEKAAEPAQVAVTSAGGSISVRAASEPLREIALYGTGGRLLYRQRFDGRTLGATLPAQSLAHGVYIVRTTTSGGTYSAKIIL
ncbi:MAG: thiol protease/hemagglutinin PrtT [Tannerellaceae bacterium]|jgi:hypothetical protein|nr:thiol protease/hemagglutinin PrtT [Tannerellaceae bacterium]